MFVSFTLIVQYYVVQNSPPQKEKKNERTRSPDWLGSYWIQAKSRAESSVDSVTEPARNLIVQY